MQAPSDLRQTNTVADHFGEDRALRAYLYEIEARLYGWMPDEEREALVSETGFWIERGARDRILASESDAIRAAIKKHGSARMVSDRLLQEHFENCVDTPMLNALGRGNGIAIAAFGIGNLVFLCFLQMRAYFPATGAIKVPFSPAEVRSVIPEWFPFPELSWQYMLTISYPVLAPIVLGWLCGRLIPVGAAKNVYQVIVVVTLSAFALGSLLLPDTEGLLYGLFQLVFWLPVGCLSAYISSSLLRRKRQRTWTRMQNAATQMR